MDILPPSGKFRSVVLGGNLNPYQCAKRKFWIHFWNPHPFFCLFDKISLHHWCRLLGVIFNWKWVVENHMCHFASKIGLCAAKLAEVLFFRLQIVQIGNSVAASVIFTHYSFSVIFQHLCECFGVFNRRKVAPIRSNRAPWNLYIQSDARLI